MSKKQALGAEADTKIEGWANYMTWLASEYMARDEVSEKHWLDRARTHYAKVLGVHDPLEHLRISKEHFARELESSLTGSKPHVAHAALAFVLMHFAERVDWLDLAEGWIDFIR
jgi:hypothetical protein